MREETAQGREGGFTLIELIVVIAILGVLASITVPTISNFLSSSKRQAYNAEKQRIQAAVDAYYSVPENSRFIGKREYPILGRSDNTSLSSTLQTKPGGSDIAVSSLDRFADDRKAVGGAATSVTGLGSSENVWNPVGGTRGADLGGKWSDDADGVRDDRDTWKPIQVTRGGKTYHTDPRYFFIDFSALVDKGLLESVPQSAAPDHDPDGDATDSSFTGSYIWYVDSDGEVRSLFAEQPDQEGFQAGVYP